MLKRRLHSLIRTKRKLSRFNNKYGKKIGIYLSHLVFLSIMGWLVFNNWTSITDPVPIKDVEGLKSLLFTKPNVQAVLFGACYGLATLMYFVLRLPFLRLEQLKFFGLEYKVQADRQEQIANEEYEINKATERIRISFLHLIATSDGYDQVAPLVHRRRLQAPEALEIVAYLIRNSFMESLAKKVDTGVVRVKNSKLLESDIDDLSPEIKYCVKKAYKLNEVMSDHDGKYSTMAIPLRLQQVDSSYCIFYLHSSDFTFTDTDKIMVQAAWLTVVNHAKVKMLEDDLEEIAG